MVGWTILRMISASISLVATGAGEYVPMPPVFSPVSPSPIRLWSCAAGRASAVYPSEKARIESSWPVMNSSTTTSEPASPNSLLTMMSFKPASASSVELGMMTPLPAARPDAFKTTGWLIDLTYSTAAAWSVKLRYSAVGMLCRAIKSFENALDPSMAAARWDGPKTGMPTVVSRDVSVALIARGVLTGERKKNVP